MRGGVRCEEMSRGELGGGLLRWAEETLRKEGIVVRRMGRGMLLHNSKKVCFEPGDALYRAESLQAEGCREAWLRICAQA